MGAPAFQWRDKFREHHVEVCSSNYALYGDMSRRIMAILAQHAPALEIYSIDEAFLRLDGLRTPGGGLETYAQELRARVKQWTGVPVGIGVGATKVLAKLANRAAKKTGGVLVLDHENEAGRELLERWPCEEVWGIARRTALKLAALGIHTAGQLMAAADALNLYYGSGTVRPATMGFGQRWQMRRERLSPCYTTRLRDVPMARL